MRTSISALLIGVLYFLSVPAVLGQTADRAKYNAIKNTPFEKLSASQQALFKSTLSSMLAKDPAFINYSNAFDHQMRAGRSMMLKQRTKEDSVTISSYKNKQKKTMSDLAEYYRAMGIENPEEYIKTMNGMVLSYKKIKEKYPELGRLDTRTRAEIQTSAIKLIKE